ncbi:MAG: DUF86 domain-containing protein [Roseburia sp.]|nr:DUF86 domain-containing protein [Roseburia sp.]
MKYSDNQRIVKMRETTQKLLDYLEREHITTEVVLEREPVRWAITTPLYNIGEQAYQLSDAFKEAHPEAPWAKISGLRHRLVHDYENTNWNLICSVLFDILPDFLDALNRIA